MVHSSTSCCEILGGVFLTVEQAEGNVDQLLAHAAWTGDGVSNGNRGDFVSLERHHAAKLALMNQVDCPDAVARGQHAVKSRGRASTLDVSQDHSARLKSSAALDL